MGAHLEVDEYDFANDRLGGLYTEYPRTLPPGLVLDRDLAHEEREAIEMEAECYACRRSPRGGRMYFHEPESLETMNRQRIMACRKVVEADRPDWVERIRFALRIGDNDTYKIIAYSGVPPYPAVAILENLRDRGELPEG